VVTLHRWKKEALIDAGCKLGRKGHESDELARARRRINDLKTELESVMAASATFPRPRGGAPMTGLNVPRFTSMSASHVTK